MTEKTAQYICAIFRKRVCSWSAHHLEFTLRFRGWFWSAAVAPEVDPVSDLLGELSDASSTRAVATMSDFGERRPLRSCWR